MDLMDEIASYLETESGFTVRWLANVLSIDINAARQHMSKYLSTNKTTCATYLLVGENLKGSLSFIVSGESEKDHVRSSFKSVHYEDIYAIHKGESVNNKTILQAGEHDQASEILMMSHPSSVHFLNNKSGLIVCPGIEVKPIGQRILSASYVKPEPAVSTKELVKSTVKKAVETPAPAVIKSKSSIQANSFFGNTASKSEKPVAAPAIAVKSEEKKATTTSNEDTTVDNAAKKRVGKIADDDDEEFDSEYKPNPSRLKERVDPARKNFSVGETVEEDSSIPIPEDEEEEGKTQGGRGKKSKVPVVVHGAMDDYMEDIAIAEHNRSTTADAPRPKKRKLVEKMFADEKGYLVTSMVWEEVTDDESETVLPLSPKRPKPSPDATNKENGSTDQSASNRPAEKKAPAAAKTKKAADANKGGQQKSMMSFFSKKP